MSLTKFTESTNIISELDDQPSLTATELKAKFDEVGGKIKTYLNNTLTTETEQLVATEKTTLQGLITALGTQIRSEISAGVQARYPVGKIIMDTANTNPATYLGFGTWELWGQGRVPVGVDTSDTDFDTVEETGGEKNTTVNFNHTHAVRYNFVTAYGNGDGVKYTRGDTVPEAIIASHDSKWTNISGIPSEGSKITLGDKTWSNVQPYITCYMWKRIA